MIRHDWVKCNDDVRQISGVCSSWLRGRDPNMTLEAFQHLWCHNNTLASIHTVQTGTEERLELKVHLSASSPVPLFYAVNGVAVYRSQFNTHFKSAPA